MTERHRIEKIQKSRPASTTASVRCDIRTLASLSNYWAQNNEPARTVAELIRISLETFLQVLVINDKVEEITDLDQAIHVLKSRGLSSFKLNKKVLQELLVDPVLAPRPHSEAKANLDDTDAGAIAPALPDELTPDFFTNLESDEDD